MAEMPLEPARWTAAPAAPVTPPAYTDPLLTQEPGVATIGAVVPDSGTVPPSLAVSRYNRFNHLFNVFSWGLVHKSWERTPNPLMGAALLITTVLLW